jgi:mycothiol system anti-sigma-R factor
MDEIKDCKEVVERLYVFLDGELTDQRRDLIRRHLDECSPCLEAFEFETELRTMISSRSKERCPDVLLDKIARVLQDDEGEERNNSALA